ncbi:MULTISPECIES: hypothetical protein [unclassified Burkholderia]|uniref:peptidylprolyl isomerase n=1 Tax=unclassified Burkholderia TaxID=2613784 RepID=UPI00211B4632|nr:MULTISPECIES: hypothetical protein [unclassified Burkholderia]MDN7425915.1 hypothetical protein [Burkholderia sp. AU45388]
MPAPSCTAIPSDASGAVAAPFQLGNAHVIVKLDEKRVTTVPTFEAAKNVLRQQLEAHAQQRALGVVVDKLAQQATIQQ